MFALDFYEIINSEISSVEFFQNHRLLPEEHEIYNCEKCGGATEMSKMCVRKTRSVVSEETMGYLRRKKLNLSGEL